MLGHIAMRSQAYNKFILWDYFSVSFFFFFFFFESTREYYIKILISVLFYCTILLSNLKSYFDFNEIV